MSSIQTSALLFSCPPPSSSSSSKRVVKGAIHFPKLPRVPFSAPKIPATTTKLTDTVTITNTPLLEQSINVDTTQQHHSKALVQLYAILEAVEDRIEMHHNVGEQRDNWNTLLLNSINMITLTATTITGVAAATSGDDSAPLLALKLSSGVLFWAAAGMLVIMNKLQPSQLAEEQRSATRRLKQLRSHIETSIAMGRPTSEDVKDAMEKVLALDKAYPLPLLGAMLDKFPSKFKGAVWWPQNQFQRKSKRMGKSNNNNGWSQDLEMEMREVVEVVKRKDREDYQRLGTAALKVSKALAIAGPLLTGIAAVGSTFVGNGPVAAAVPLVAGSLAAAVNALEHGGQVGMVFEMYRNSAGFFDMLEGSIESTLGERDLERRENGEVFEMKMALKLGRSLSQLRELASKSASCRMEGIEVDEFASKLL